MSSKSFPLRRKFIYRAESSPFITMSESGGYEIAIKDISTRRGLIRTIHSLMDTYWVTNEHIRELIELSAEVAAK